MRLEFESNVTAFPLVKNEIVENTSDQAESKALLNKGISAAQAGDRELARTLLTKASEMDPKCADAWMWLASISEYPEQLLAFLNKVLEIEPANSRASEWKTATCGLLAKTFVQRADDAHNEGDTARALQCLDQALEYDHDCEAAWFKKSAFVNSEDDRVNCLKRVLSINVENHEAQKALDAIMNSRVSARIAEAKTAAFSGENDKALEIIGQVLDTDDSNIDAWLLRSHLSQDLSDKVHALKKALEIEPDNAGVRASYDFLSSAVAPAVAEIPVEVEQAAAEPEFENAVSVEIAEAGPAEHVSPFDTFAGSVAADTSDEIENEAAELELASDVVLDEEVIDEPEEHQYSPMNGFDPSFDDGIAVVPVVEVEVHGSEVVEGPTADVEEASIVAVEALELEVPHTDEAPASDNSETQAPEQTLAAPVESVTPVVAAEIPKTACPYCWESNEVHAIECGTCHAPLSLSDIESVISNPRADQDTMQKAVAQMEAEAELRSFDAKEMIALGIGQLLLGNFESGLTSLLDASALTPNDVILSGQINTLVIRLEEIRRQTEIDESRPKGRTILVVDDSATVRKLISSKLEKSGHAVICAQDGIEGLARIDEQIPDLVLLDITMPRMDGYEVCKQIRSNPKSKDIPIVMISGKDGFLNKVRGRMAGTTAYITKPFGPETLMKALQTYLINPDTNGNGADLHE